MASENRPRHWAWLIIERDGERVDVGTKLLFCPVCCDAVEAAITRVLGAGK